MDLHLHLFGGQWVDFISAGFFWFNFVLMKTCFNVQYIKQIFFFKCTYLFYYARLRPQWEFYMHICIYIKKKKHRPLSGFLSEPVLYFTLVKFRRVPNTRHNGGGCIVQLPNVSLVLH